MRVALILLGARSGGDVARDDLGLAALLLMVAGWIVFLLAYEWWGRHRGPRHRRGETPGSVSLPDDSPAVAHALINGGTVRPAVIGIVLLDLGRRGYLGIEEQPRPGGAGDADVEWTFTREQTSRGDLRPYENAVYTRVFAGRNETTQSSLIAWAETHRPQARVFLDRVQRSVAAEMREKGYLEQPRRLPVLLNLAASGVVILVGLTALVSGAVIGLLAIASGAFQASRTRSLRRHTLTGPEESREWAEVAHALEEVAQLEEAPAGDRPEWERCLVYAVALGVGEAFAAGLQQREKRMVRHKDFLSWYQPSGEGSPLGSIGRVGAVLGETLAEAAEGPSRLTTVAR